MTSLVTSGSFYLGDFNKEKALETRKVRKSNSIVRTKTKKGSLDNPCMMT